MTFPYGGLQLSRTYFGDSVDRLPDSDKPEPDDRLLEYFACTFGDTARQNPRDAIPVVESLFNLIRETFPDCSIHTQITERNGWFEDLEMWITSPTQRAYLQLDWSVS